MGSYSAVAAVGAAALYLYSLTDVFTSVFADLFNDVFTGVSTDIFTGVFTGVLTDVSFFRFRGLRILRKSLFDNCFKSCFDTAR